MYLQGVHESMTMVGLVAVLLAVFVAVVLLVLGAVVFRHFAPLLQNPPGVPRGSFGWPLVGETLGFLRPHASNTTGDFLHDHVTRYGAVFKWHLFGAPTVVSCDAELNHLVLQNEARLFECSYPGSVRGILGGSSMLVATGELHRRLRSTALALVASARLRPSYLVDVDRTAASAVASWRGRRGAVKVCDEARKFAFSVIVEQMLGLGPDEPVTYRILQDYRTFMKGLVSFPLPIPGTPYARAVKARSRISLALEGIIQRMKGGSYNKPQAAFLYVLLSSSNELSHDDKVSFVLDILLAGYETTSREHESIKASKGTGEFLTAEDYKKMEYIQQVINETLRCGNVVKFVHRKALKDVRYKGYLIPAAWKVLPIFGAVHLDPSLHVNPQQFVPCRWKGMLKQMTTKTFAPFGGGLRLCPGSELGRVEVAFFLHYLVLSYRWRSEGEDVPMTYPYVEFKSGLPMEMDPI